MAATSTITEAELAAATAAAARPGRRVLAILHPEDETEATYRLTWCSGCVAGVKREDVGRAIERLEDALRREEGAELYLVGLRRRPRFRSNLRMDLTREGEAAAPARPDENPL
jgi:hypothetical protein